VNEYISQILILMAEVKSIWSIEGYRKRENNKYMIFLTYFMPLSFMQTYGL